MSAGIAGGAGIISTTNPSNFKDVDLYDPIETNLVLLANQLISTLDDEYLKVQPEKTESFKKEIAENLMATLRNETEKAATGHFLSEEHPISISNLAMWIRHAFCENRARVNAHNREHRLGRIGYGKLESTLMKMASQVTQCAYAQKQKDTGTALAFAKCGMEELYRELFPEISATLEGKKAKKSAETAIDAGENLLDTSTGSAYSFEGLI